MVVIWTRVVVAKWREVNGFPRSARDKNEQDLVMDCRVGEGGGRRLYQW